MINKETGLTENEQKIMDHLTAAWNEFCRLPHAGKDLRIVGDAIHRIQDILALRIVLRDYPEGWTG